MRERIASESLQKIRTKFYEVAGHVGRIGQSKCNTTARIN